MKRYLIDILLFAIVGLVATACDSSNDGTSGSAVVSFGAPLMQTQENVMPFRIPVVLSHKTDRDVTVMIEVKSEDGAKEFEDYRIVSKQTTIAKGTDIGYFEVELKDVLDFERDKIFTVELLEANGARLSESVQECKVVIKNSKGYPVLSFGESEISRSEGDGSFKLGINLSRAYDKEVKFKVNVKEGGSAVEDVNFSLPVKEFTWPAGTVTDTIVVNILDDNDVNPNRFFELVLEDAGDIAVSGVYGECKVTLINEDVSDYVSFGETSMVTLDEPGQLMIPVKINGMVKNTITVRIEVEEGTAKEGVDFNCLTKELEFLPGAKEKFVIVDILGDDVVLNDDLIFKLKISEVENGEIASENTTCTVTLRNDDFDYELLYDKLLGTTWKFTVIANTSPGTYSMTLSGGRTPEEEYENYQNMFICNLVGYMGTNMTFRMSYDKTNGDMQLLMGDTVRRNLLFSSQGWGYCDVLFDRGSTALDPAKLEISADYRTLKLLPVPDVRGGIYDKEGNRRGQNFTLTNVEITR